MTVQAEAAAKPAAWTAGWAAAGMQAMILLHRYVGAVMGLLMTLWCLSGFVMMYTSYPNLTAAERIAGLAPLQPGACCDLSRIELPDDATVSDVRIEMLAGEPVLRAALGAGRSSVYRLGTGERMDAPSMAQLAAVARDFGAAAHIAGAPGPLQPIDVDQWTVSTPDRYRPIYKVRFDDRAGSEIYISGADGQVILDTDRKERILGWLGPVPHWLYPRLLKRNGPLWSQIVIWTSTVGVFLTVIGLWIGVVRFRRRRSGRWSPYRGLMWQHHIGGLIFGLLTLTWVFSGLMTMGPWGLLRTKAGPVRRAFAGDVAWGDVKRLVAVAPSLASPGAVLIEGAPLGGRLHALVHAGGKAARFDLDGRPAPVSAAELRLAAAGAGAQVTSLELMLQPDDYYYPHQDPVKLPVQRLILDDPGRTRLYVDPDTGKVLRAADAPSRARRWVETSLHDLDFPWLRARPLWDVLVVLLLSGVTFVCGLGAWLGLRRLGHDLGQLRRFAARRVRARRSGC